MADYIYLLYGFAIIVSIAIVRVESGGRVLFTPVTLFVLLDIFVNWPGLVVGEADGWLTSSLTPLIFLAATVSFALGVMLTRSAAGWTNDMPTRYQSELPLPIDSGKVLTWCWITAGLMVAGTLFLHKGIPQPLIGFLRDSTKQLLTEAYDARFNSTKSAYFGGEYRGQGFFRTFNLLFSYMISAGGAYLIAMHGLRYWRHLVGLALILIAVGLSNATRGDLFVVIASALIACGFLFRVRVRHVILAGVVLMGAMIGLTALQGRIRETKGVSQSVLTKSSLEIVTRILAGNSIHTVQVIEMVQHGFLIVPFGDTTLTDINNSIPFAKKKLPLAFQINRFTEPHGHGITTFNTMTYLGPCFADFGLIGVIIIYFLLAFVLTQAEIYFLKRPKSLPGVMALVVLGILSMLNLPIGGPIQFLPDAIIGAALIYGFTRYSTPRPPTRAQPIPASA